MKKSFLNNRIIAFAMVIVMVLSLVPVSALAAEGEDIYYKVLDVANLKVDDRIIIVAADDAVAMSTEQKTNNRAQTAVAKSDDGSTVTFGEGVQVITLEEGIVDGTFAFQVGDGYLYAASSSSNHLKTDSEKRRMVPGKLKSPMVLQALLRRVRISAISCVTIRPPLCFPAMPAVRMML